MGSTKTCDQALKEAACRIICQHPAKGDTPVRAVALNAKVWRAYAKLTTAAQAQLLRTFRQWCEGYALPDGKHKQNEGRAKRGDRSIMRQAFAAEGVRLYGWVTPVQDTETFILVDCDVNKKKKAADQKLLAEVGRKVFVLIDLLEDQKL